MPRLPSISISRWGKLPLQVRLAVGASIVELVLPYCSREALEHYRQFEALELIWQLALGKPHNSDPRELCASIVEVINPEDGCGESCFVDSNGVEHHFTFATAFLAASVLDEVSPGSRPGVGITSAVGASAQSFAFAILDREFPSKVNDNAITDDVIDALMLPVYLAAKKAYQVAKELQDDDALGSAVFADVKFDESLIPRETIEFLQELRRKRGLPPQPE